MLSGPLDEMSFPPRSHSGISVLSDQDSVWSDGSLTVGSNLGGLFSYRRHGKTSVMKRS